MKEVIIKSYMRSFRSHKDLHCDYLVIGIVHTIAVCIAFCCRGAKVVIQSVQSGELYVHVECIT